MLEIDRLTRHYGPVVALDELTFSVPRGQLVGFLGPNGAGKTTAFRIAMGVERADQGAVRWDGAELGAQARQRVGYLPEERGLYPKMKVRDQLVWFGRMRGMARAHAQRETDRWLAELGLEDRAGSRTDDLSLGNQQRVQLAVALLHQPDLLLLDEPFSGLDPLGVEVMVGVLRSHADAGGAVVFSSHQLDLVEGMCDAVAVIHRGRAVLTGPVEQVRSSGPRRLVIGVAGDHPWRPSLPGVSVEAEEDDGVRVRCEPGVDEDALLADAQRAGRLTHLRVYRPSLAELFREAVGMTPADAEAEAAAEGERQSSPDAEPGPAAARPLDRVGP